jgi:hypothetical protein
MKQYRVTKYNPMYRGPDGAYTRSEWTSYNDIGKSISEEKYLEVENSYIESALKFLEEQNISELEIEYLENIKNHKEPGIMLSEGESLNYEAITKVLKGILREKYWAKLAFKNAFIHLGWDYYMYIGVPNEARTAKEFATSRGLFVEEFQSPYYENEL